MQLVVTSSKVKSSRNGSGWKLILSRSSFFPNLVLFRRGRPSYISRIYLINLQGCVAKCGFCWSQCSTIDDHTCPLVRFRVSCPTAFNFRASSSDFINVTRFILTSDEYRSSSNNLVWVFFIDRMSRVVAEYWVSSR